MGPSAFPAAVAAWREKFAGREDSLDATWELAEVEECWGDSLFFGGEPGGAAHYHAAMRALVPPGTSFSSSEENDRRMQAYTRLTNKLYAVGPDGKSRPVHDAQPHPSFKPIVLPKEMAPKPPAKSKAERRAAVMGARQARTKRETEFGRLHDGSSHQQHYQLGKMWFEAAESLAPHYPAEAHSACDWSRHFFELYNQEWTANLPASRWDSDGSGEISDGQNLKTLLSADRQQSLPPDWVRLLLLGEWRRSLAAFGDDSPAPEFKPLGLLLADACQTSGRPDAARQVLAKLA